MIQYSRRKKAQRITLLRKGCCNGSWISQAETPHFLSRSRPLVRRGSPPVGLAICKRQQLVHGDDPQAPQPFASARTRTTTRRRARAPPRRVDDDPDVRVQVHQDLPAPPARAEHRHAVVAHGDHVREGPGGAAPAGRRLTQDHELGAGAAVEVCDVDTRENGVAVCAEGRGADLVCVEC